MLCALILYMSGGTRSLTSSMNDGIFERQSIMRLKIGPIVQPRQPFESNYIPLLNGKIVLSNKREIWENIQPFFFIFQQKKKDFLADPFYFVLMSDLGYETDIIRQHTFY